MSGCLIEALCSAVIGLHMASVHAPATYPAAVAEDRRVLERRAFETFTPGAYVVFNSGLTVGALRNSYGRGSAYIGWTWRADPFAITAGAITGYGTFPTSGVLRGETGVRYRTVHRGNALQPLLVPSVGMPITERATARLSLIPSVTKDSATALHLSIEWR